MADTIVELRPSIRMQGDGTNEAPIVLQHPAQFGEEPPIVLNVLDDIKGTDEIECPITECQGAGFACCGDPAAPIELLDRECADIDEMCAGDRQSGAQPRPDFQSRRRTWQQL